MALQPVSHLAEPVDGSALRALPFRLTRVCKPGGVDIYACYRADARQGDPPHGIYRHHPFGGTPTRGFRPTIPPYARLRELPFRLTRVTIPPYAPYGLQHNVNTLAGSNRSKSKVPQEI